MQNQLIKLLFDEMLIVHEIEQKDYPRQNQLLVEKYQDRPMDLGDGTLVLAAERLGRSADTNDRLRFFLLSHQRFRSI